jgi:hypothetical protein
MFFADNQTISFDKLAEGRLHIKVLALVEHNVLRLPFNGRGPIRDIAK